jgi:hypothetical protein
MKLYAVLEQRPVWIVSIERNGNEHAWKRNALLLGTHAQGHVHATGQRGLKKLVGPEAMTGLAPRLSGIMSDMETCASFVNWTRNFAGWLSA